jgi:hypothetical protein
MKKEFKRIWAVAMVKNEGDIIEAFIRYHCSLLDGVLILDNLSHDETPSILDSLIREGLPLFVEQDQSQEYDQQSKTTQLINKAFETHGADLVIPLDADEFLVSENNSDVLRHILEDLDVDSLHYAKWRTYVPDARDDRSEPFVLRRMHYIREEKAEQYWKVLIHRELWTRHGLSIIKGNHDVMASRDTAVEAITKKRSGALRIAHFPLRSSEQVIAKIAVHWMNILASPNYRPGESFHIERAFRLLLGKQSLTIDDLTVLTKEYSSSCQAKDVDVLYYPVNWPDGEGSELKYSPASLDWLSLVLMNAEQLAREQGFLKQQYSGFTGSYAEQKKAFDSLLNSRSWRITRPLRSLVRLFKGQP